jgi:hemerythrin-like domain-containing protein
LPTTADEGGLMKATALLKKQHRKVEGIFERIEEGGAEAAADVIELANDLAAHMAIEQDLFYPAVRDIDPKMVGESYQEHAVAELALKRLLETAADDTTFAAKVTALKELIEHHVEEEEEELFPKVEEEMEADRLESLGEDMATAFDQAAAAGYESLLPEGLRASADASNKAPNADGPERPAKRSATKRSRKSAQ